MINGLPVVGLDCDDVVCRCVYGMAKEIKKKIGHEYTEEDIKTWDVFHTVNHPEHPTLEQDVHVEMKKKGWCLGLEPFEGAIEGVNKLKEICEVYFVTAPYDSEHWEYERRLWLKQHFGVERWRIIQGGEKCLVRPDIFVDDKTDNINKWVRYMPRQGHAVLWDRPHNRQNPPNVKHERVRTWAELYTYVAYVGYVNGFF